MQTIKVDVLEQAFKRIIDKLHELDIKEVEVTTDLYRLIPTDNWEVDKKEDYPNIGSLKDDLTEIEKLVKDNGSVCTFVDFDRVASLLRAISQAVNPTEE